MSLVNINFKPDQEELKKFGVTMVIGFSIFALIAYFVFGKINIAIGLVIFGVVSFVLSRLGKAAMLVYIPWMGIALVMGTIVNKLIMCFLFFIIITPIALVFKAIGRDAMNQEIEPNASSYWQTPKDRTQETAEDYQSQF